MAIFELDVRGRRRSHWIVERTAWSFDLPRVRPTPWTIAVDGIASVTWLSGTRAGFRADLHGPAPETPWNPLAFQPRLPLDPHFVIALSQPRLLEPRLGPVGLALPPSAVNAGRGGFVARRPVTHIHLRIVGDARDAKRQLEREGIPFPTYANEP